MKKTIKLFIFAVLLLVLNSCGKKNTYEFKYWNDSTSLNKLISYVDDVTNKESKNYIPEKDRIVTFDMDGTLLGELYPTYFEYNLLEYRVLEDETYKSKASESEITAANQIRDFVRDHKALPDHFDLIHANAQAKAFSGMSLKDFNDYVDTFAKKECNGFDNMTYYDSFYKPMIEVINYLESNNFTNYVVSGSDRFICRTLLNSIGFNTNKVIGMDVKLKSDHQEDLDGLDYTYKTSDTIIRTDELIIKNLKTNKVKQIAQEIGKKPVLSFGNSSGDEAMHNYCLSNENYKSMAFMLVADDDQRDHANLEKATKLNKKWIDANYNVISMKNDFKTIYGNNITKKDFIFN